jgi:phage FluMu protein Com
MNIRCSFCQTPYTLSRVAMLDALQEVDAGNLTHYDAHCPRCRRATQIPRQRLEMAMPNWREELKQFEKEMKEHPQQEAPLPDAESTPVAEAAPELEPAAKKGATKAKPSATPAESKPKTASRQTTPSADTAKSNAKKSAAKGTSKKSK